MTPIKTKYIVAVAHPMMSHKMAMRQGEFSNSSMRISKRLRNDVM